MNLSEQQFGRCPAPYNGLQQTAPAPSFQARSLEGTAQIGLEELAISIKTFGLLENLIIVERARTLYCLWRRWGSWSAWPRTGTRCPCTLLKSLRCLPS